MTAARRSITPSVQLATDIGDTVKRIDGTEVPLLTPWIGKDGVVAGRNAAAPTPKAPATGKPAAQQAKPAAKKAEPKKATPKKTTAKAPAKATKADAAPAATGKAKKPRTMKAPRKAGADDLKQLKGVGPKLEQTLNELGFWHFDQIAKWGADEIAWVDDNLKFKGRIERDGWIEQAKILAEGGETEFSSKVKKGKVY